MERLKQALLDYLPYNKQEEGDKKFFLKCINSFDDVLVRENEWCHFTSSAFIVNQEHTKVLSIFHNIYKSWGWVGGHCDGDGDTLFVAKKETAEETGIVNVKQLSKSFIAIDSLPVLSHFKRGKFVPGHIHLNVTYLFEASEADTIRILEDENSDIDWLPFDNFLKLCKEPHMIEVYKKIIERTKTKKF